MEKGLQRDQTAQQHRGHTADAIRRAESPVNWRFCANTQQSRHHQVGSKTLDFWKTDWYVEWGQVTDQTRNTHTDEAENNEPTLDIPAQITGEARRRLF